MSATTVRFAHGKLRCAIQAMACSELSRRGRLVEAVKAHIRHVFPLLEQESDLPGDISVKTAALMARLTERGSYRETIQAMSDEEVNYVIGELVELYGMLARAVEPQEPEEAQPQEDLG